ncbi:MAG TPA: carboxylating nicotinate-nucleotide diphosphorylase [Phycisphaerae bacterium]|nr:carboxylating nicotinate-nucleotide diphosphorylase [Phycisphaerae bacterium]
MPTIEPPPLDAHLQSLLQMAVNEDMVGPKHSENGGGDKTVELAIPESLTASATIVARTPGTLAGAFLLAPILALYKNPPQLTLLTPDGSKLARNQPIAKLQGSARTILSAERTLLNFLGHLSGIATLTAQYVDAIADINSTPHGTPPKIVDTRKTTPAFRTLDKYAVRCGGGHNHRIGLYDGVMLKDNHLLALREKLGAGGANLSLAQLTHELRKQLDPAITLWLEVDTLDQLKDALQPDWQHGADIILLDNFTPAQMHEAVHLRNAAHSPGHIPHFTPLLEASGGITLDNLRDVAATGIDRIAIGALTHSAKVLDLSMEFE